MSETIWLLTAEVAMDAEVGFINVVLWASSAEDAMERAKSYFAGYDWEVISVDRVAEIDPDRDYGDEINQMIDETRPNPQFIRLGTYFTYPMN